MQTFNVYTLIAPCNLALAEAPCCSNSRVLVRLFSASARSSQAFVRAKNAVAWVCLMTFTACLYRFSIFTGSTGSASSNPNTLE